MGFQVIGTISIEEIIETETEAEAALSFMDKHGSLPDAVGGRVVVGGCETCGLPIFDGDKYGGSGDNELVCLSCYEEDAVVPPKPQEPSSEPDAIPEFPGLLSE